MRKTSQIRTVDVPQADHLPSIRRVVEAVHSGQRTVSAIAQKTGFSDRHVRYRLQAARILGLITEDAQVTARGRALVVTGVASEGESTAFRNCFQDTDILSAVAPGLLTNATVDVVAIARRLQALAGLSRATAERRAMVFRSWHRQLNNRLQKAATPNDA